MEDEQRDAGGYTPGQIKGLKIAIGVMTAAIVLGLLTIVLTIAYRASTSKRSLEPDDGSAVNVASGLKTLNPAGGVIALTKIPAGAHVVSVAAWGDRLALVVEDGSGSTVLVLDPKSGKIEPLARLQPAP
jgi:Family of unknown function (DUF6476)